MATRRCDPEEAVSIDLATMADRSIQGALRVQSAPLAAGRARLEDGQ
jgi:hypothetical protein